MNPRFIKHIKFIRQPLVLVVLLLQVPTSSRSAQQGAANILPIALPDDPSIPVITMDWRGGLQGTPRRTSDSYLTVRGDGTVTVVNPYARIADIETRISSEELQGILRFALQEEAFPGLTTKAIDEGISEERSRCGRLIEISDAPTTVVRIRTAGLDHEVSFNALSRVAPYYPMVIPLAQFRQIEKRLMRVIAEARAGSKNNIAAALTLGNEYLKKNGTATVLEATDLAAVDDDSRGGTDRKIFHFARDLAGEVTLQLSVAISDRSTPEINVFFTDTTTPLVCHLQQTSPSPTKR